VSFEDFVLDVGTWIRSLYWNRVGCGRVNSEWRMIRVGRGYMSKSEIWYHRVHDYFRVFLGVEITRCLL
jgi:hypothetical protein